MHRWVGKVAVVTGASAGIGAAIAVDLVKAGMIVVGLARRKEAVEKLRDQIPSDAAKAKLLAFQCDVTDDASVVAAFEWIGAEFGAIHVLVNCAGVVKLGAITDDDNEEALKSVLQTNLWGLVLCTKKAVELMKREKVTGAHIININSVTGHKVIYTSPTLRPRINLYPVSKFGVTALTEVLRQEFNFDDLKYKVTVSSKIYKLLYKLFT